MLIEFVHCFGCRIPVTPSGRRFIVDGEAWPTRRDATPDMFDTTCRMMGRINRERAADAQDWRWFLSLVRARLRGEA